MLELLGSPVQGASSLRPKQQDSAAVCLWLSSHFLALGWLERGDREGWWQPQKSSWNWIEETEFLMNALDSSYIFLLFAPRMSWEQLILSRQNASGCIHAFVYNHLYIASYSISNRKEKLRALWDSSVSKELSMQTRGSECTPQNPPEKARFGGASL